MTARDELIEILWQTAVADRVRDGKDLALVPVVRGKVEEVADAILAAGFGPVQAARAEAWDEGFEMGEDYGEWSGAPVRNQPSRTNPYRTEASS